MMEQRGLGSSRENSLYSLGVISRGGGGTFDPELVEAYGNLSLLNDVFKGDRGRKGREILVVKVGESLTDIGKMC